jgi:hypothetical protein
VPLLGVAILMFAAFSGPGDKPVVASPKANSADTAPKLGEVERSVLHFNGKDQWVTLPANLFRKSTELTLEAWFRTGSPGGIAGYQSEPYPKQSGDHVPIVYVGTDGLLRAQFWTGTGKMITTTDKVTSMAHNHLGVARTGDWVASPGSYAHFNGSIAEVRVWYKARSPEEIARDIHRTLTGNEPDLAAYFALNELEGDTAYNRVPHGGRGALVGKPARVSESQFLKPQ